MRVTDLELERTQRMDRPFVESCPKLLRWHARGDFRAIRRFLLFLCHVSETARGATLLDVLFVEDRAIALATTKGLLEVSGVDLLERTPEATALRSPSPVEISAWWAHASR